MIRIELSEEESRQLARAHDASTDPKFRLRARIVLMAHRGRPRPRRSHKTTTSHSGPSKGGDSAYLDGGPDALAPRKAKGPEPKLTEDLAEVLREWVIKGPAGCGPGRANWTYEELAVYLHQQKSVEVKKSALQVSCRKHGIRPYRPTYRFLDADPEKQDRARGELAELKKS